MDNHKHPVEDASTTEGLPISPSMAPTIAAAALPVRPALVDRRVAFISLLCVLIAFAAAAIAEILMRLIGLVTNISFYGHFDPVLISPPDHISLPMIAAPVIGGLIVGVMARFGSAAIRGHGIPEAMEQVLLHQSRIPPRVTFLKPLSAAIAIGTGGPFGAEGPIIATGSAIGSVVGQALATTAAERKTLLAAGAAAGMAATFGSPVSAVLLAIELLLFEFRPRSFIPVALAATVAAGARFLFKLPYPVFKMPALEEPNQLALLIYIAVGALVGLASVYVTRAVYFVEDFFAATPIHWMWWPALGAIPVGIIGYYKPHTLGVGYENISDILSNPFAVKMIAALFLLKFVSWAIALGSGTSGGTLAPLFTIGAGLGAVIGAGAAKALPFAHIDLRVAALVGMAAMFAGASRALLASAVFAFETTLQPLGLLPLLGGCTAAYFVSSLMMSNTIMTEKIARHGVHVPAEYVADFLDQVLVSDVASADPVTLAADETIASVRQRMHNREPGLEHQGFPVVDGTGLLMGVVTRRNLTDPDASPEARVGSFIKRPPIIVYADSTLRDAADHMVSHEIGRLPVVSRAEPGKVIGMVTRSDMLSAHHRRLDEAKRARPVLSWPGRRVRRRLRERGVPSLAPGTLRATSEKQERRRRAAEREDSDLDDE